MGTDGPVPDRDPTVGKQDQAVDQPGCDETHRVELDLEALEAEIGRFLAGVPVAETVAAKLDRLLCDVLKHEVLPVADRAAGMGVDPGPLLGVISDLLRCYADALKRSDATGP